MRQHLDLRVVVDIIAGASAGGINGIFLAKALANNEDFAQLKTLWIHQGDIGKLLNDEPSRDDDGSLPEIASPLLTRELVYTGLTRAQQAIHLMGPADVLQAALERRVVRVSNLGDLAWGEVQV